MTSPSSKSVRSSVVIARIGVFAAANDVSAAWVIRHANLESLEEHGDQAGRPPRLAVARRKAVSGRAVSQKIAGLLAGGRPRVLDLFAACGRLLLELQAARFELHAAVESYPDAAPGYPWSFRFYAITLRPGTGAAETAATPKSVVAAAVAV